MDVIPAIDVRHAIAVRARGGRRADYRALETPLAAGSDPVAVALGLRSLFAFPRLYVADLDGIEGRGRNAALPGRIAAALPGVELWIDDGGLPPRSPSAVPAVTPVIGSESVTTADGLEALRQLPADSFVLSLDFSAADFLGPARLLEETQHWPERIIVMTLSRVGGAGGPDLRRIADIAARGATRRVYAAGGVRHSADVTAARAAGAAGAIAATALHSGAITAGDLGVIAGL
jgi:phosphoribosylformimino-5-aminoimidazole carboxamide ribotide isomerase